MYDLQWNQKVKLSFKKEVLRWAELVVWTQSLEIVVIELVFSLVILSDPGP